MEVPHIHMNMVSKYKIFVFIFAILLKDSEQKIREEVTHCVQVKKNTLTFLFVC